FGSQIAVASNALKAIVGGRVGRGAVEKSLQPPRIVKLRRGVECPGLIPRTDGKAEAIPLKNLIQFGGIYLQCAVIPDVERHGVHNIGSSRLQEQLVRLLVAEELLVFKTAPKKKGVHAGRPFMVPASYSNRMLIFVKPKMPSQ